MVVMARPTEKLLLIEFQTGVFRLPFTQFTAPYRPKNQLKICLKKRHFLLLYGSNPPIKRV